MIKKFAWFKAASCFDAKCYGTISSLPYSMVCGSVGSVLFENLAAVFVKKLSRNHTFHKNLTVLIGVRCFMNR